MRRNSKESELAYQEAKNGSKKKGKNPLVVAAIFGVTFILCILMTWWAGNLEPLLNMLGF